MNRMLANLLSTLNVLFALFIVLAGVIYGATFGQAEGSLSIAGAIFGGLAGLVVAASFCGLIAFLALIEGHLSFLVDHAEYQSDLAKRALERQQ